MKTLSAVFAIGIPCSAIAIFGALIMDTTKMDMSQGGPSAAAVVKKAADIEQGSITEVGDNDREDGEKSDGASSLDARHKNSPPGGTSAAETEKAQP